MDQIIAKAHGQNGSLELTRRYVRIKRKGGFFSSAVMGVSGDKELLISRLSAIQVKKPDFWMKGFIQFTLVGGREERSAAWDVARDENSVIFNKKELPEFEAFKAKTEELMDAPSHGHSVEATYIQELEKLSELHSRGIISEEEFQAKKKLLLGL